MLVQFAGRFAQVVALNFVQNGICLGVGAFSLVWGLILKIILPAKLFNCLSRPAAVEEEGSPDAIEEEDES